MASEQDSGVGPIKILVAGDTKGKFKELFERVSAVNKKNGPFHMLLCVGDFFPEAYVPDLTVPPAPITTYVLGPTKVTQLNYFSNLTGCELAENVTYLGQRGIYNDSRGLKLAYFSGTEAKAGGEKSQVEYSYEDVKNYEIRVMNESNFKGVDILLTSQWPLGIDKMTSAPPMQPPGNSSPLISRLASTLKPRYHFGGLEGIHYERAPYRNHQVLAESTQQPTRFIALATVANAGKKKWLYAFNIVPMKSLSRAELVKQPENITEFPYANVTHVKPEDSGKAKPAPVTASTDQFFYDSSYTGEKPQRGKRYNRGGPDRGGKRGRGDYHGGQGHYDSGSGERRPPPGPCWFCLASPEVEKHLIVSIGDHSYLTLAKGGLTDDHVLILPIGHFGSTIECPPEVLEEIEKFKASIKKYFASIGKGVIFYERNYKSPHLQIQAVPIPADRSTGLKIPCIEYAESEELEMQDFPSNATLFQMTRPGYPYFYLELPDSSRLFIPVKKNFPVQFGRELISSQDILNCPEKVDWKACKVSTEEESRLTKDFREAFKAYDFTV